jgi:hypothetical protein
MSATRSRAAASTAPRTPDVPASSPGPTRRSVTLNNSLNNSSCPETMDARVEPAHDGFGHNALHAPEGRY